MNRDDKDDDRFPPYARRRNENYIEHQTWGEYRELVLKELERLNESIRELNEKLDKLNTDDISDMKIKIAMLEVRSGVWGAIAGTVTGLALTVLTKWHV
jgi:hypothetical protein